MQAASKATAIATFCTPRPHIFLVEYGLKVNLNCSVLQIVLNANSGTSALVHLSTR